MISPRILAILLVSLMCDANTLSGTIIVDAGGESSFEGFIGRDNLNVSLAALNVARETDLKETQHVMVGMDGYLVEPREGGGLFSLSLPAEFEGFELEVVFPGNSVFKEISTSIPYRRSGSTLFFNESGVENPRIDVVYENAQIEAGQVPSGRLIPYLLVAVSIVAGALILRTRENPAVITVKKDILDTLNYREKDVVGLLAGEGGMLSQVRIREKTGTPKSTLSNTIRGLEQRKIVKRTPNGSTFDIELSERVRQ